MLTNEGSVQNALEKVKKHFHHEHKHMPTTAINPSRFSDNMRCLTTYEPRADPESHLLDYVIPTDNYKWEREIMEMFMEKHIIEKAKKQGYKDFKYTLYGNKDAGPLSFKITIKKGGAVFLCQPPGKSSCFNTNNDIDTLLYRIVLPLDYTISIIYRLIVVHYSIF